MERHNKEVEFKYIENGRNIQAHIINEKEKICNRVTSNQAFGRSIKYLKNKNRRNWMWRTIHAFVVINANLL